MRVTEVISNLPTSQCNPGYVTMVGNNADVVMSDKQNFPIEWVTRSRAGDNDAMQELYAHFKTPFYNLAFRYTRNAAVAEDLLQDIFVKIFLHVHELDKDEAFVGWAYRIAVNTCLSYLRRKKTVLTKMIPFEQAEGMAQKSSDLEHEKMVQHSLDDALFELSSRLKSVFILHDIQGFKHAEIAQILGCSIGTSKSQLFKARMKIRKKLEKKQLI